jgi:gamma-glutamylcyclotransferase (GGCT)/AIG2-like uncharacterized protein YtfP
MKTEYTYFAYGSNMLTERITERLGLVRNVGVGTLRNHRLVFNRMGSYLPGGVASVVPRSKSIVLGVIWKIDAEQLSILDKIEDPSAYRRETINVDITRGESIDCVTYVSIPQGYCPPSVEYLSYLVRGAEEHNFPDKYVRNLKRRSTRAREEA